MIFPEIHLSLHSIRSLGFPRSPSPLRCLDFLKFIGVLHKGGKVMPRVCLGGTHEAASAPGQDLQQDQRLIFGVPPPSIRRPCRSYLRRYAFNLSSMKCEEFIYGGCYGNGNNFRDLQSCVDHCKGEN
uniref:Tissue factor pathway inhibitor 2 n=1 Tax=Cyanistes caeruleus TaxID=156563 RepID=A0A8C0V7N1_CYACU